jgi:hypothetical protein
MFDIHFYAWDMLHYLMAYFTTVIIMMIMIIIIMVGIGIMTVYGLDGPVSISVSAGFFSSPQRLSDSVSDLYGQRL